MEIVPKEPSAKASSEIVTGDAWYEVVYARTESPRMGVYLNYFAPCARTAWHMHPDGQALRVTEGIGLMQSRGGEIVMMRPGDTSYTPPGEWHWHGADADHFMTSIDWEGLEIEWGNLVTDEEYNAR